MIIIIIIFLVSNVRFSNRHGRVWEAAFIGAAIKMGKSSVLAYSFRSVFVSYEKKTRR